jgi:flagellar protein FliO/FliZ
MDVLDWGRALFALVATLALIGLLAFAARRLGVAQGALGGQTRRIRVIERLSLDPRRQLALVAFDGREHLILLSPFGDKPIASAAAASTQIASVSSIGQGETGPSQAPSPTLEPAS